MVSKAKTSSTGTDDLSVLVHHSILNGILSYLEKQENKSVVQSTIIQLIQDALQSPPTPSMYLQTEFREGKLYLLSVSADQWYLSLSGQDDTLALGMTERHL